MAHNPFNPPRAELELDEELGPVPARVRIAVAAVISGAVMSFALKSAVAFGFVAFPRGAYGTPADILPATMPLIVLCVLAWKIFVGRDWARWILAAIAGLGALGLAGMYYLPADVSGSLPQSLLVASVIQLALNFTAFVLLFTGDAGQWFRH
jgi:hypothetical protein